MTTLQRAPLTFLTNACGEETGYGTLPVLESDYELIGFESGPGVLLTYLAQLGDQKVLLANLEVAHKDDFWLGDDEAYRTQGDARSYCEATMAEIQQRLPAGAVLLPLDENDPGRFVIRVALPLCGITSREHGQALLAQIFAEHAD